MNLSKGFKVLLVAAALFAVCRPAAGEKMLVRVTPKSLTAIEGLSVKTERLDDGHVEFTIVRDPAKARWPARAGHLEVGLGDGPVARCSLEPEESPGGVAYSFVVSPDALAHSKFVLTEVQGGGDGELIIGGGTYYEMQLGDFESKDGL